ncbi:hypothetical protein NDU88_005997 [Pleurodeles waltl]|uniref:Uncharacterized protein n=1 Tax=Pleurodeles waltl TaxID=8319 RepID=A0AAV7UJM6_PLEWA|nr:hypothetical protein NDU88_005997 [Pleurodeles waltl]
MRLRYHLHPSPEHAEGEVAAVMVAFLHLVTNQDKLEEEAAGREESESAYKEDKRDPRGDYKGPEKQEVEGNAYKTKGDVDQACEGDARRECGAGQGTRHL